MKLTDKDISNYYRKYKLHIWQTIAPDYFYEAPKKLPMLSLENRRSLNEVLYGAKFAEIPVNEATVALVGVTANAVATILQNVICLLSDYPYFVDGSITFDNDGFVYVGTVSKELGSNLGLDNLAEFELTLVDRPDNGALHYFYRSFLIEYTSQLGFMVEHVFDEGDAYTLMLRFLKDEVTCLRIPGQPENLIYNASVDINRQAINRIAELNGMNFGKWKNLHTLVNTLLKKTMSPSKESKNKSDEAITSEVLQ